MNNGVLCFCCPQKHQQLQQRARGAKPSVLGGLPPLAHVQGHRIVQALRKPWAAQSLLMLPEAAGAAAALPDQAMLSAAAHRSGNGAPALGHGSASDARKQAEYVRHLEEAHRFACHLF